MYDLVSKGLSIDNVGVSRDTEFQEIRPGAGFETADFVKTKVGRATVVRLVISSRPPVLLISPPEKRCRHTYAALGG